MDSLVNLYLLKAENPAAYKKLAEKGIMVGFPARVAGQTHRPDIGIPYHSTVKFFDPDKDKPEHIHETAKKLNMVPPDPKKTRIEPGQFKDRMGNDVYVIKLHGPHADAIKGHNKAFSHLGFPQNFEYQPHISVDKKTWDHVVNSKATTAHEAGISFGPAELRQGHNILATYRHNPAQQFGADQPLPPQPLKHKPKKLAASEDLQKGFLRNFGIAAGMAGALATSSPAKAPEHKAQDYSSQHMLNTISQVESSGGKQQRHDAVQGGMHHGEHAYGKYALMPTVIRETVRMNPELHSKYRKASMLHGKDLHRYMNDNPGLEEQVAQKHLQRLEHHFGKNPAYLGYAWLEGIKGTYQAKRQNLDVGNHWHVQKIKQAYTQGK